MFIAGSKDNYISIWSMETGKVLKFFSPSPCDITFVTFLNFDKYFYTASFEGEFKIF